MSSNIKHFTLSIGIGAAMLAGCATDTDDEVQGVEISEHEVLIVDLQTGEYLEGTEGELERDTDFVETEVETHGLPANTDVVVIWAIFNNVDACTVGNPVTGSTCGPADLANNDTGGHISFYDFQNTGPNGELELKDTLLLDDTSRCIPGLPCRDGLTNPATSEVHVVIIDDATGASLQGAQFIP